MKMAGHIIRDLQRKAADDVRDQLNRTLSLLDDPFDRSSVALIASGSILGVTTANMLVAYSVGTPDEIADAIWFKLRPIIIETVRDLQALEAVR